MTGLSRTQRASTLLLDVWDGWNGLRLSSNNPSIPAMDYGSSVFPAVNPLNSALFPAVTGAVGALAYDAAVGRVVQTWPSGAGPTGMQSAAAGSFAFPMGKRFALPGSVRADLLPKLRRYRVDFLPRVTVAGAAEVVCGAGFDVTPLLAGNNPALCWSSRPGVNAGRWMPRYRLVTAGAIIDGPDSNVTAAAFRQMSIVLEEGPVPRVRWLVDGLQVWELAGDANMPEMAGAFAALLIKAVGGPAGTTTQWAETRFRVEEM